jgi:hypothetical protein
MSTIGAIGEERETIGSNGEEREAIGSNGEEREANLSNGARISSQGEICIFIFTALWGQATSTLYIFHPPCKRPSKT